MDVELTIRNVIGSNSLQVHWFGSHFRLLGEKYDEKILDGLKKFNVIKNIGDHDNWGHSY